MAASARGEGDGSCRLLQAGCWIHLTAFLLMSDSTKLSHVLFSLISMHINCFPDFLLPDARAKACLRGGSLGMNTPSAVKSCDRGEHGPVGSQLLCRAVTSCDCSCLDPQSRAWVTAFRNHFPLSPALRYRLCPKFLQSTQVCVGMVNVSCKGQGKQKRRSDSNYLMH